MRIKRGKTMGILDELKQSNNKTRITINLDADIVKKIDELQNELNIKSRSYVINKLLRIVIRKIEREKKRIKNPNLEQYKNKEHIKAQEQSPKEQNTEQPNKTQFITDFYPYSSLDKIAKKRNQR
jgi:Arc/MetJ-type ribon-helix-helix transcriptional regulator